MSGWRNAMKTAMLPAIPGILVVAVATFVIAAPIPQDGPFIDDLLRRERFSVSDIRTVNAGQAVVKSLDTPVRQELAHFGVVRINVPAGRFIERFRDIERFESGPGVPQIRRFSTPPRIEDLASLELPAKDVAALRQCHPNDCEVNFSNEAISRFRSEVNWSSATATGDARRLFREQMLGIVKAYHARGNASLGRYDHDGSPVMVAEEFRALLNSAQPLPVPIPGLVEYLDAYPRARPSGAEDLFYWSVVDFGLKPTVRLNHVVIQAPAGKPSGVSHAIAIKQLYASHYFHTTLELRFLIEDARIPGFYLVSITRSRSDGTTGLTGSLLRPIINRRSRNAVRGYLEHLKRQVEAAGAGGQEAERSGL
jgi:hypothetical protein